jgi:hypothetical protein
MDLALLEGEILFASNGIYRLFPRVCWRPNYYTCVDAVVLRDQVKEIAKMQEAETSIRCFFPETIPDAYTEKGHIRVESFLPPRTNTCYFKQLQPRPDLGPVGLFPTKPENGLVQPYTVTATLIQLAYLMGCCPIYLIGCDTHYQTRANIQKVPTPRKAGTRIYQSNDDSDPNHFDPAYFGAGNRYHDPNVDKMVGHYEAIQQAALQRNIEIYNAGVDSQLETFPKVEFERLFSQKKRA